MKKVLIYKDNSRYEEFLRKLEAVSASLHTLKISLDAWGQIEWTDVDFKGVILSAQKVPQEELSMSQIHKGKVPEVAFGALKEVVSDQIKERISHLEQDKAVFGLKLKREKLKEMFDAPLPGDDVAEALNNACKAIRGRLNGSIDWKYFVISKSSVSLNMEEVKTFEESCAKYATTKPQIEMATELFKVCDALNSFDQYISKWQGKGNHPQYGNPALFIKNGTYYPNYDYIIKYGK